MTATVEAKPSPLPYRLFRVVVHASQRLSHTFLRLTFTGPELDRFADNGFDQRVVLALPLPEIGYAHLPSWDSWHAAWRNLPDAHRNPLRTYTVRSVRRHVADVDVDVVLHPHGKASRWAETAQPGDEAALLGPDNAFAGEQGGVEFRPPAECGALLLAGDETAVPAIAAILERLPSDATGEALMEVPHPDDALELRAPIGMRTRWMTRHGVGGALVAAARSAADRLLAADGLPAPRKPYAWAAGEATMVRAIRHHLVSERRLSRSAVSPRDYWVLSLPAWHSGRTWPEGRATEGQGRHGTAGNDEDVARGRA